MATYTPPLFNDLGKKARDLFTKKYNFDNSATLKHKKPTKEGTLVIESTGSFNYGASGRVKATCENKQGKVEINGSTYGSLSGTVEAKEVAPSLNLTLTAGCGKSGCSKKKDCGDKKAACGDKKACDTKTDCKTDTKSCEYKGSTAACLADLSGCLRADYRRDMVAASAGAGYCGGKVCATGSAVVGHKGWSVGGEAKVNVTEGDLSGYKVAAQYEHEDAVVTLVTNKFKSFELSAYHPVNRDYTVGFQYHYYPEAKCNQRSMSAGVEYVAAADTTIKARASTCGKAALNVEHRLANPKLLLAFSAGFALPKGGAGGGCTGNGVCPVYPDKFGVQVTFGDF